MSGRALSPLIALLIAAALALAACPEDEPRAQALPPCEPPPELVIERSLKRGWRALALGERDAARGAFESVLRREPSHPEAHKGLRTMDERRPRRDASRAGSADGGQRP